VAERVEDRYLDVYRGMEGIVFVSDLPCPKSRC
jgi:hypothetical protein